MAVSITAIAVARSFRASRGNCSVSWTRRAGAVSQGLKIIQNGHPGASISLGGFDPVKAEQQMIKEMDENLQLGIGFAVRTHEVRMFLGT